jgi:hypothetical protein
MPARWHAGERRQQLDNPEPGHHQGECRPAPGQEGTFVREREPRIGLGTVVVRLRVRGVRHSRTPSAAIDRRRNLPKKRWPPQAAPLIRWGAGWGTAAPGRAGTWSPGNKQVPAPIWLLARLRVNWGGIGHHGPFLVIMVIVAVRGRPDLPEGFGDPVVLRT